MPVADESLRTQFEAALSAETYSAAWRYAWRLATAGRGGCREEAEDLLQEALAHAWRQFGQLRERSRFKPWLLCIIRTRYLNRLRTARRRPQVAGEVPDGLAQPETDPASARLQAALAQLTPAERELLGLVYGEGLSLAEAGEVLGANARLVRQRLYRARQNLRAAWLRDSGLMPGDVHRLGPQAEPGRLPGRTL